ncbi:hypothetical protein LJR225_005249 [Phenylobacterium sp. LjRoot225]|uniref:hypothetical protein n=1 Tax=Phenylobacterium sp. LjRoot225 TaxID=3342285 RepID=UPI003ED0A09E
MVHRTYYGLGPPDAAVCAFEGLKPYAAELLALQSECRPLGSDYMAVGVALDGLQTAAYHFTRRRDFYHELESGRPTYREGNDRLSDRAEAIATFRALTPHVEQLRKLQLQCRPFGRDYCALEIAKQSLETAAFHFTREERFYAARNDSAGPIRPAS